LERVASKESGKRRSILYTLGIALVDFHQKTTDSEHLELRESCHPRSKTKGAVTKGHYPANKA